METILFVDDEIQILKSIKRLFMDTEYNILTAESGACALSMLEHETVDLVITDMRMPVMDGYQLLCNIKALYPDILRVILSGYSDEDIILKALQCNIAKLYIFKPWNNEELLKLIGQLFETERFFKRSDLLSIIKNIDELPTIKSSYIRILDMIDRDTDESDMAHIASFIETDQSISTEVLHVVNSAFYGIKTGSIKQAITYLGFKNLRNIILSTSIIDSLESADPVSGHFESLWEHAFVTNKILFMLYDRCLCKKLPETSNSAGLLHNIGVVFLLKHFSSSYFSQIQRSIDCNLNLLDVEKDIFNVTHTETGGYLLKWWELPLPIVEAALYHHNPFDERIIHKELVMAVHIAQKYAYDHVKIPCVTEFYDDTFDKLGIDKNKFEEYISELL